MNPMLREHYKLAAEPFDVTLDPRFLGDARSGGPLPFTRGVFPSAERRPEVLYAIAVLASLAEQNVVCFDFASADGDSMSRNFELLKAETCRSGGPTRATEEPAVAAKKQERTAAQELTEAESVAREESLRLVQRLFLTPGPAVPKAVMFAPVDSENGCSWLCAVIAKLLAESVSGSVCLVEGNFRAPSLPQVLGVDNHYGLGNALTQEGAIRSFGKQLRPDNFWLVSAGSLVQDSLSLLVGDRMKQRVTELRREFDYVVIDAPPLNAYADGMILSRLVDGVVLVLEANGTRREAALRVTESLRATKIPVLGAVLNNRTFPIPAALYKRL
jgi:Mrp family chromosome partitioning ATPase